MHPRRHGLGRAHKRVELLDHRAEVAARRAKDRGAQPKDLVVEDRLAAHPAGQLAVKGDEEEAARQLDRFVAGRAAASRQGHRLSRRQVIGSGRVAVLLAVGAVGCRRG